MTRNIIVCVRVGVFMTGQLTIHEEIKIFLFNKTYYLRKSFHRTLLDQTVDKASIPAVLRKSLVKLKVK